MLGLTAKAGFIFGDAGPFFTELYSMGGTQFGIPLRGYEEFSITPNGFDPIGRRQLRGQSRDRSAARTRPSPPSSGIRISQSLYFDVFFDAGNVYRTYAQFDPSRLFRGAGVRSGRHFAAGTDRDRSGVWLRSRWTSRGRPDPGWKLHFRLGNFF